MGCGTSSSQMEYVVTPPKAHPEQEPPPPPQHPDPLTIHDIPKPETTLSIQVDNDEPVGNKKAFPSLEEEKHPEIPPKSHENEDELKVPMVHEKMGAIAEGTAVMFGQSENERKIIVLDC